MARVQIVDIVNAGFRRRAFVIVFIGALKQLGSSFVSPVYGQELEKNLMSESSGHFKRLMVSLTSVRILCLLLLIVDHLYLYAGFILYLSFSKSDGVLHIYPLLNGF